MEIIYKILIVDDRPENLVVLEKFLAPLGVGIYKALSGNEAISLSLTHEVALAIIDVQMPVMDGYETVKRMRNVVKTRYVPVIFLSSVYSENHYPIEGIETGAIDFISKPIVPKILLGKVNLYLELYKQHKLLDIEIENRKATEQLLLKTESELKIANGRAEESDKLKTAFLANMSHEIRTPLNAIVGFSNLLSVNELTHEKRDLYISYINNSSETLTTLISDLIDTAKIEAGQLELNNSEVQIAPFLREIFEGFKDTIKRNDKQHLDFTIQLPDNIYDYTIEIDRLRLQQVITNLLTNALKFTRLGSIVLGIKFIEECKPVFYVKDTGIGIPQENQAIIFERFRQLYSDDIPGAQGTGLGLAIVKRIVELMGGTIWIESEPEVGSCFLFTVNARIVKPVNSIDSLTNQSQIHINSLPDNLQILIAEDEETNYFLLEEILKQSNAKITWVKNGRDAVDAFTKKKFDIILMDLKMPIMSGYEALDEIRKFNTIIPVIAQTAYAMSSERDSILNFGFDAYIAKPIDKNILLELIADLVL